MERVDFIVGRAARLHGIELSIVIAAPELFGLRVANSVRALSSPAALHARFERDTAAATERASLPKIRERVGHNAVDVFGDDHAVVLLNALVYQPRPVFQTHQTYSPVLAELNASFYAGATAPEYVLMRPQTIDSRFLPADDARVLPILLQHHHAVLEENGWLLLQRHEQRPSESFTRVQSHRARFGERIVVPEPAGSLVRAEIHITPTLIGRVRTFLYKAAQVTLTDNDSAGPRSFRLIRPAAVGGFLVAPLVWDADEYRELLHAHGQRSVVRSAKSLIVDVDPAQSKYYQGSFNITFAASPAALPLE